MKQAAIRNLEKIGATVGPILHAARIPGAVVAVAASGKSLHAEAFGYRDLKRRKPLHVDTAYPIASTTKAMNATLLGMLVDEGLIDWDAPVQRYIPRFRLSDPAVGDRVTVRDLITMRTGLPRHDWVWIGNPANRSDLIGRLPHLALSTDFRARFQYSNLSATTAGHIAEVVTGKSWEALMRQRIFQPLRMRHTACRRPGGDDATPAFLETARRKLVPTQRLDASMIAPAGGAVYSNVGDMCRWISFNLQRGRVRGRRLISEQGLARIHAPQVVIGERPLARLPSNAAYALGWVVDYYNGHRRIWHGGYLHEVNSSVMLFPEVGVGIVSFINFGCPGLADLINQYVFDVLMDLQPAQTYEEALTQYDVRIADTKARNASVPRTPHAKPSRRLDAYAGLYRHPGYGDIRIICRRRRLILRRHGLQVPLVHWHYDTWIAQDSNRWIIHVPHVFDRASPLQFHTESNGQVAGLSIAFEPEVAPIRFVRERRGRA